MYSFDNVSKWEQIHVLSVLTSSALLVVTLHAATMVGQNWERTAARLCLGAFWLSCFQRQKKKETCRDFACVANLVKTVIWWLQSWKLLLFALAKTVGQLRKSLCVIIQEVCRNDCTSAILILERWDIQQTRLKEL